MLKFRCYGLLSQERKLPHDYRFVFTPPSDEGTRSISGDSARLFHYTSTLLGRDVEDDVIIIQLILMSICPSARALLSTHARGRGWPATNSFQLQYGARAGAKHDGDFYCVIHAAGANAHSACRSSQCRSTYARRYDIIIQFLMASMSTRHRRLAHFSHCAAK